MLIRITNKVIIFSLSIILLQSHYVEGMKKALENQIQVINLQNNTQNKFFVLPQELILHILSYCDLHSFENFFLSCSAHYEKAKKYGNSPQRTIELEPWLRKYKKLQLNEVLNSIPTECFKDLIIPTIFFGIHNSPLKITNFLNKLITKPATDTKIYTQEETNAIKEVIEKNKLKHRSWQGKIHINDLWKFPEGTHGANTEPRKIAAAFALNYSAINKNHQIIYINTHSIKSIKDFLQQQLPIYNGKKSILIVNSSQFAEIVNILENKNVLDNIDKLYIKTFVNNQDNLNGLLAKFPNTTKISITNSPTVREFPDFRENTKLKNIDLRRNFIQVIPHVENLLPSSIENINLKNNYLVDPEQIANDAKNINPECVVQYDVKR